MTLVDIEAPHTDFRRRGEHKVPLVPHPTTGKDTPYGRPSSHGKWVEDGYGLELWGKRMVAVGVATTPSIIATIASLDHRDEANKKQLNELCKAALIAAKGNEAADVGTALHRITERVDRGELSIDDVPKMFKADVEAMLEGRQANGLTVVDGMIEVHCVCDELRLAGTFDRILTDGTRLYSSDLKTGKDPSMAQVGYSVQGAVYSRSVGFDPVRNERYELPKVDQDTALIEHLPAGRGVYQLYALDISDDGGWGLALLAHKVKKSSRRKNLIAPFENVGGGTDSHSGEGTAVLPAEPVVVGLVENPTTTAAAHNPRTEWLLDRTTALVERLGKAHLAEAWPTDVARPAPVRAGEASWTDGDIDAVASALDALEARHDVPFGPDDPKVVAERRAELDAVIGVEAAALTKPKPEPDPHPEVETGPMAPVNGVRSLREILRELKGSTDADRQQRAVRIQHWQTQAAKAGVPWYTGQLADDAVPLRLFHIVDAAVELADLVDLGPKASDPDHRCRDLVAAVVGDQLVQQPTTALGAALGLLTVDQAKALAEAAHAAANSSR